MVIRGTTGSKCYWLLPEKENTVRGVTFLDPVIVTILDCYSQGQKRNQNKKNLLSTFHYSMVNIQLFSTTDCCYNCISSGVNINLMS